MGMQSVLFNFSGGVIVAMVICKIVLDVAARFNPFMTVRANSLVFD